MESRSQATGLAGFARSLKAVYGAFETEPTSTDGQAAGALAPVALGPFDGFLIRARAVRSIRPALAEQWSARAFILMPLIGELVVDHYDRKVALAGGDMVLMDSRAPCIIDAPARNRSVVLGAPREMVTQLRADADRLYAVPISGQQGVGRMLSGMIRTFTNGGDACDARDSAVTLSVTMAMLDRALEDRPADRSLSRARADAAIARMRDWVETRVGDPELDVEAIAGHFGLSRRSLYRLFAEAGTTPGHWLCDLRLDQARRWLAASGDYRSIGQIAYAAGFNDSSHFTRLFKRRFGVPPSTLRR